MKRSRNGGAAAGRESGAPTASLTPRMGEGRRDLTAGVRESRKGEGEGLTPVRGQVGIQGRHLGRGGVEACGRSLQLAFPFSVGNTLPLNMQAGILGVCG